MSGCCRNQHKMKLIKINFGRVSVGSAAKRTFKVLNESCVKQCYEVHRDPEKNPLDEVFKLDFYNWDLLPGVAIDCVIEYHPNLPFHQNIGYLSIMNCDRICHKIFLQGTSIGNYEHFHCSTKGPNVVSSVSRLAMICSKKRQAVKKCLRLTNASEMPAIFMFDIDEVHCPFKLDITKGTISANNHTRVVITFSPPSPGLYTFNLPCLIHHQVQGFCYFDEYTTDMTVKWIKNLKCVFNIEPSRTTIPRQKSGIFQVNFHPNKPDTLFSEELLAEVFWEAKISKSDSNLNFLSHAVSRQFFYPGHSFSPGSIGWIPLYELPQTVILPPCLPQSIVYTTFLINSHGQLAMTFRFIPPQKTQFIVKPMVGIIHRDYQIVVVQFFPETKDEQVYVEQWSVQFNGNPKNEVPIEFMASTEYPKLSFGGNNKVEFPTVHPGCEEIAPVTMRNITRHCIRYTFSDIPSSLNVNQSRGIIQANEILTHEWLFCPKDIGDHSYVVNCCVTTLEGGNKMGMEMEMEVNTNIPLEIIGKAESEFLVALPEELNFGTVAYGETKKLSFQLFNSGSIKIHYKLRCEQSCARVGHVLHNVKIEPLVQTILPGSDQKIDIYITPSEPGFHQLIVQYLLRPNALVEDTLSTVDPRDVCKINCMCVLPSFEIKDLLYLTNEEYVSKAILWNLLGIDQFNAITNSILPGNKEVIHLRFPESVLNRESLLIKLLVVNSTAVQSTWDIKRVKKCDCQQIIKTRGLTFKYKEYCCNHRLACTIFPKKGVLLPHDKAIITIQVCYVILGMTSLQWQLSLSKNRSIIINADIVALSQDEGGPSLLTKHVSLEKTYIGDMDAVNQMCWLYNSTDHEVTYTLDINPLYEINIKNMSEIFRCRNPHGTLLGRSHLPIIFKFQPRSFGSYKVNLPLQLGHRWTNLSIEAETDISYKTKYLPYNVSCVDQFAIPEIPVHFSIEHITASPMPVSSKLYRVVMIFNESKNQVIGYQWRSYNLPNIIEIFAEPASGRIQPTKVQSFRITIISRSHPSKITANLCCEFLDLSAQSAYTKSIIEYDSLCTELAGQFVITEEGMTEPKPRLKRLEKPKPFTKSLSISLHIYGLLDADLKATLNDQLKSTPPAVLRTRRNDSYDNIDKKLIDITTLILEGMIWEVLNSNMFVHTLKESLTRIPDVKYGQYKISPTKRWTLENKSYDIPPMQFLASIFEQIIFGIIHEEFGLSLNHFKEPADIRQFCYQKREPRSHMRNTMCESESQGSLDQFQSDDIVRVGPNKSHHESQVKFNVEADDSSDESRN
ncbi:cilia- and flagella-associated protein 65-like [Athalia rosae]|uniref:cilia- and flagella-associated protein 65-like n=1 Tax=Athalia rosae TaxID=37344 RepID=UPI002033F89D|nr:cilia- and flagella-associated protein 65-like [Athalia rosae]